MNSQLLRSYEGLRRVCGLTRLSLSKELVGHYPRDVKKEGIRADLATAFIFAQDLRARTINEGVPPRYYPRAKTVASAFPEIRRALKALGKTDLEVDYYLDHFVGPEELPELAAPDTPSVVRVDNISKATNLLFTAIGTLVQNQKAAAYLLAILEKEIPEAGEIARGLQQAIEG